jgi:hypothetical protein
VDYLILVRRIVRRFDLQELDNSTVVQQQLAQLIAHFISDLELV